LAQALRQVISRPHALQGLLGSALLLPLNVDCMDLLLLQSSVFGQRVSLQLRKRDEVERAFVGAFKHNRGRDASLKGLLPSACAQAPTVSSSQPSEAVLRPWCAQVIAHCDREIQKFLGYFGADHMAARIMYVCFATTVAVKARQGIVGAGH
jgi:hypothetical protein